MNPLRPVPSPRDELSIPELPSSRADKSLKVTDFPSACHPALREIDDEGNDVLESDELTDMVLTYAAQKKAAKDGSIAICSLPKEIQPTLKVFDVDGDGTVAPMELARGAELYKESKNTVKRLTILSGCLLGLCLLMLAAITGLVFAVVELSKEQKTDSTGVVKVAGTNTPVSNSVNQVDIPLGAVSYMPSVVWEAMNQITITDADDKTLQYIRYVRAIDVQSKTSLEVETTKGDVLTIKDGDKNAQAKMANGKTFAINAVCSKCSALNAIESPEVTAGLDEYMTKMDPGGMKASGSSRKLLGWTCW